MPQTVLLLVRKRDHPVGHAEIVADGKVVPLSPMIRLMSERIAMLRKSSRACYSAKLVASFH